MTDDVDERWLARALGAASPGAGDARCIDEEPFDAGRLWAFKQQEAAEDTDAIASHLAACAHCRGLTRGMTPFSDAEIRTLADRAPRSSRRRWLIASGLTMAAAAAAVLFVMRPAPPSYVPAPLLGAAKDVRGEQDATIYRADNAIRWQLDPAVPMPDATAKAELIGPDGRTIALTPAIAASGTVSVRIPVGPTLGTTYGIWTLRIGVSNGGAWAWHDAKIEYRADDG